VALLLTLVGCGEAGDSKPSTESALRPVLLVSGKDEHGEVELRAVPLYDAPRGRPTNAVRDGTLVRVTKGPGAVARGVEPDRPDGGGRVSRLNCWT
jgi:hypothetical protein